VGWKDEEKHEKEQHKMSLNPNNRQGVFITVICHCDLYFFVCTLLSLLY